MQIISKQECQEWLSANLGNHLTLETIGAEYPHWIHYQLPADTGRKTQIARLLSSEYVIDKSHPGLFWITGWSAFPYNENLAIFYGYRKSLGEDRRLIDAPGHIFAESDLEQLECLFDLSLYFYWDASLFDGLGTVVVRCDNDEWISIYAKSDDRLHELVEVVKPAGLKRVGES